MAHNLLDLLFHPASFFERQNRDTPDFLVPVLIVGAVGLISLGTPYFIYTLFPENGIVNIIYSP